MKAALLEGERERERAYEYVVSRFPQTDTLVPGFALHENTCLWRERESCNRAAKLARPSFPVLPTIHRTKHLTE
jgi:hypothetical protein